jgi:hypothetical protein
VPDLFAPEDLAGLPGDPFDADLVTQAGEAIRNAAGWHIAPEVTETLTVDSAGGPYLFLKTKRLSDVTEIRDVTDGGSTVLTGWTFNRLGRVTRLSGWPCDGHTLEVDVVHGFDEVPAELLRLGASLARGEDNRLERQQTSGPFSTTYEADAAERMATVLDPYMILTF